MQQKQMKTICLQNQGGTVLSCLLPGRLVVVQNNNSKVSAELTSALLYSKLAVKSKMNIQ